MIDVYGQEIIFDTKLCRKCNTLLPIENFQVNRKFYDKTSEVKYRILRRPDCISCRSIKSPIRKGTKKFYPKPLAQFNCPICDNIVLAKDAKLDHCHTSGNIRGYLCNGCNTSLGSFKESIEVLKKAIKWLQLDNNDV